MCQELVRNFASLSAAAVRAQGPRAAMGELKGRRSLENGAQASRKPREDQQRGNSQRNLGKLELLPPPRLSPVAAGGEDEGPTLCPAPRGLALKRSLSPRFRARALEPAHSPDLADPFPVRGRSVRLLGAAPGPQSAHCGRDTGNAARAPVALCPCDNCRGRASLRS